MFCYYWWASIDHMEAFLLTRDDNRDSLYNVGFHTCPDILSPVMSCVSAIAKKIMHAITQLTKPSCFFQPLYIFKYYFYNTPTKTYRVTSQIQILKRPQMSIALYTSLIVWATHLVYVLHQFHSDNLEWWKMIYSFGNERWGMF